MMGNVCANCIVDVAVNGATVAFNAQPIFGREQGFQIAEISKSDGSDTPWRICAGQENPFIDCSAEDFMLLVILLNGSNLGGHWVINGRQCMPDATTLYQGSALCGMHLLNETGKAGIKDGWG